MSLVLKILAALALCSAIAFPALGRGSIAAIGGGAEDDTPGAWSTPAYRWIVERGGGRRVVILSVLDETDWLPRYFESLGASDAVNLKLDDRSIADSQATYDLIVSAGVVFLKGGDQAKYVATWKGTATERAIVELYRRGGVVAGTSAGAHVLGSLVYDARAGSVYPEEAIRDPYVKYITFTDDFVGLLPGALVDTHFTARGRVARLLAMVARWDAEHAPRLASKAEAPPRPERWTGDDVLGIGVDENTALLVDSNMRATVSGEGTVTFVRRGPGSAISVERRRPPVFTDIAYDQLTDGFVFDLERREIVSASATAEQVSDSLPSPSYAAITLQGALPSHSTLGAYAIANMTEDTLGLLHGALRETPGTGQVGNAVVVTAAFADPDFIENRTGGLEWALARHPRTTGLLLDEGSRLALDASGRLVPQRFDGEPSTLVLDTRDLRWRDFSHWRISPESVGPRQSVALAGVHAHLIASGWAYDMATGVSSRAGGAARAR